MKGRPAALLACTLTLIGLVLPAGAEPQRKNDAAFEQLLDQAHGLVVRRHLDRAMPLINRLLMARPDNSKLWAMRGICEMQPGEEIDRHHAEARRCLNKAVALDPGNGEAFFYLADLESFNENWPSTIAFAEKACNAKDSDKTAYRLTAVANDALNRPKEALAAINHYIDFRPKAMDGPPIKAAILEKSGDYAGADKVYKEMIALKLIDKYVMADARCLAKLGKTNDAITMIGRLLSVNGHDDVALRERAKLYSQTGKYNEAIKDLSVAIDEAPSVAAYKQRAELYKKINRLDLCKKDLDKAAAE